MSAAISSTRACSGVRSPTTGSVGAGNANVSASQVPRSTVTSDAFAP